MTDSGWMILNASNLPSHTWHKNYYPTSAKHPLLAFPLLSLQLVGSCCACHELSVDGFPLGRHQHPSKAEFPGIAAKYLRSVRRRRECKSVNLDKQLKQRTERSETYLQSVQSAKVISSATTCRIHLQHVPSNNMGQVTYRSCLLFRSCWLRKPQPSITSESSFESLLTQFPHIKPFNPTKMSQLSNYLYMLSC